MFSFGLCRTPAENDRQLSAIGLTTPLSEKEKAILGVIAGLLAPYAHQALLLGFKGQQYLG